MFKLNTIFYYIFVVLCISHQPVYSRNYNITLVNKTKVPFRVIVDLARCVNGPAQGTTINISPSASTDLKIATKGNFFSTCGFGTTQGVELNIFPTIAPYMNIHACIGCAKNAGGCQLTSIDSVGCKDRGSLSGHLWLKENSESGATVFEITHSTKVPSDTNTSPYDWWLNPSEI